MKTAPQLQADITAAESREAAWAIIQNSPEEMRSRLVSHARTVFAIRQRAAKKTTTGLQTLAELKNQLRGKTK